MAVARWRLLLVGLFLCSLTVSSASGVWYPKPSDFTAFLGEEVDLAKMSLVELRHKVFERVRDFAEKYLHIKAPGMLQAGNKQPYPYFHWIPAYVGSVIPGGPALTWSAPCFAENSAQAVINPDGSITVTINVQKAASLLCSENYLLGTVSSVSLQHLFFHGSHTVQYTTSKYTAAELFDINQKGVRIFRFTDDIPQTVMDLLDTVLLFWSEFTQGVSDSVAARNLDFMEHYAGFKMFPRNVTEVPLDESLIQSGDFFGIVRLDGLDPMLAWAMGSTTGHTTVAIRVDGELYIAESTTKDSYWPTNGVQMTPYKTWMAQAKAADYNLVWAPLSEANRKKFNATAAYEWFKSVEGLDYGFHTILWAWIDTLKDNYPCLPPDYTTCMTWQHVEILFGVVGQLIPQAADLLFNEAFNLRLGTEGLKAPELFQAADLKGYGNGQLPAIVEQDSWRYHTTRNGTAAVGQSMVCCVFVCNMWKAAGLFQGINDEINCGELTNWDVYSMAMFNDNYAARPAACAAADPSNPLCQLQGKYTLTLNDFNTKKMYPHMAEHCPGLAPDYKRPSDC